MYLYFLVTELETGVSGGIIAVVVVTKPPPVPFAKVLEGEVSVIPLTATFLAATLCWETKLGFAPIITLNSWKVNFTQIQNQFFSPCLKILIR